MATINTLDLRVANAKNLVDYISDEGNTGLAYAFVGKSNAWPTGDESPPVPQNSNKEFFEMYDNLLALKKINEVDVYHMIPRLSWTSGIIYDIYRHDYSLTNPTFSGKTDLIDAPWIVVNQNNDVYVCLYNNDNSAATVEPVNTGNEAFYTTDGYQWLKVYTLTSTSVTDYSTTNLIPIIDNDVVDTTDGEIYTVIIDTHGTDYTSSPAGVVNQIPYYYCNITGDGTGAAARISINNGSISEVKVVRGGQGYTYGHLDFRTNYVYESLGDLDTETNGLNPLGNGDFTSTVIVGPPGGWGTDLFRELASVRVAVFSSVLSNTDDFLNVSFRQVGILKGVVEQPPLVSPNTMNATYAVKLVTQNAAVEVFRPGEIIHQLVNVNGETKEAKGIVVNWGGDDEVTGILSYIQDPRVATDVDGGLYAFTGTNAIVGETTGKIGTVVDFDGEDGDRTFGNGYSSPESQKYTGELVYLSNISPVVRQDGQNEKIILILTY